MNNTNYKLVNTASGKEEVVDRIEFYPDHITVVTATIGIRFEKNEDGLRADGFTLEEGVPEYTAPVSDEVVTPAVDEVVEDTLTAPADEVVLGDEENVSEVVIADENAVVTKTPEDGVITE